MIQNHISNESSNFSFAEVGKLYHKDASQYAISLGFELHVPVTEGSVPENEKCDPQDGRDIRLFQHWHNPQDDQA